MWTKPWKLKEGIAISSGLVCTGLLLQYTAGPIIWSTLSYPLNLIAILLLGIITALSYYLRSHVYFLRYLLTSHAAVSGLIFAVGLTILMGLIRQGAHPQPMQLGGMTHMLSFWPFVLIYSWMVLILGVLTIHQVRHFSWLKLPSLLCHVGLWIIIVCGTLGSADMQRLKMYCELGQPEWRGIDAFNKVHELPIAIQLNSFDITEYPPQLVLVNPHTQQTIKTDHNTTLTLDSTFRTGLLQGYHIRLLRLLPYAAPLMTADSTTYTPVSMPGATCAAEVQITSPHMPPRTGWVTSGTHIIPSQMLTLTDSISLAMPQPEPQRYTSHVQVLTQENDNVETMIQVNKPFRIAGWTIYQYSYDQAKGKWSTYSVFELVTDPWLPAVYTGIGLLLLGAIGLFITAQRHKSTPHA